MKKYFYSFPIITYNFFYNEVNAYRKSLTNPSLKEMNANLFKKVSDLDLIHKLNNLISA